jgi:imidazolonepropionase-like amidohydrolase
MIRPEPPRGEARSPSAEYIESWPEAKAVIDRVLAGEPDVVKILHDEFGWGTRAMVAAMTPELLRRTIEYINDRGVRTTTQASHEFRGREAIYRGVDTFSHPIAQGPVSDRFVALMAAKRIPMQSTLVIGESYSRLVEDPGYLDQPLYRAVLPAEEIARLKGPVRDHYRERGWTWWWQVMTPVLLENVRKIHDAGGIIAMGSDQSDGPASHRELELLVQAGIQPIDVIRIATLNSAVWLGMEDRLGTIERGKLADLLLLEADPSLDIANARRIVRVIKGGALIDRAALELPVNE